MKKVLFIGDAGRGGQSENVQKIFRLFLPVFMHSGVACVAHVSSTNRLIETSEWVDSWHSYLSGQGDSHLCSLDLSDTAVVGFEVPDRDLAYLSQQQVPWVNLEIHPLRFMDDLYFNVTSSFDYDFKELSASPVFIDFCANAMRIRYGDLEQGIPEASLAIFGQMPCDKSVFWDGGFRSLDCYFDQIDRLAEEHQKVFYRPHPYLSNDELDKEICRRYDAEIFSGRDVYRFFSSGRVATVCAISSSVIFEAPHFGVRGVFLESRAKRFGEPVNFVRLLNERELWFGGLLGMAGHSCQLFNGVAPNNFLRDIFGYWGYVNREREIEENLVSLGDKVRLAEERANQAEARLEAILSSKTWHLTAPLRWAIRLFRMAQFKLRRAETRYCAYKSPE